MRLLNGPAGARNFDGISTLQLNGMLRSFEVCRNPTLAQRIRGEIQRRERKARGGANG